MRREFLAANDSQQRLGQRHRIAERDRRWLWIGLQWWIGHGLGFRVWQLWIRLGFGIWFGFRQRFGIGQRFRFGHGVGVRFRERELRVRLCGYDGHGIELERHAD
jgi:hypothetical protein